MYTVQLAEVVYVLHAFQKKSKRGIETPREERETIKARLRWAERIHAQRPGGRA